MTLTPNTGLGLAWRDARSRSRVASPDTPAAPAEAEAWLRKLFPRYVRAPFAERHREFWRWVWPIELESAPDPFVAIWSRGGGKSTSAELAVTALGCRGRRKYVLYVRQSQDKADESVSNIAAQLEGSSVAAYYPLHADRLLNKFGSAKGWRRNRLRTAGGFTVDAIGLDTIARGAKVDEQRPDLIVLDDIDDKLDTLTTTAKKIAIITTSILPAGSPNVAILAIQNLIIGHGFFTRMADGRADYLSRRIVSGPHPAVEGLVIEKRLREETGITQHVIVGGTATWEGQNLATCQKQIEEWGPSAFTKEAQHEVMDRIEGLALRFDQRRHLEDVSEERAKELVKLGQVFGGVDFGAWRFAFVLRAVDKDGVAHQIGEYFAQRGAEQNHDTHATAMHAILTHYGCPKQIRLWGDAANPSDITELNRAFKRINSPFRVTAVAQENKIRKTSVDRLNDMLDRGALKYRRGVTRWMANILGAVNWALPGEKPRLKSAGEFLTWLHGQNAASAGTAMEGSRLLWEVQHWAYPIPQEGKAQEQDPDDHSADGADMIACDRYGIMSWWRPGKEPPPDEERSAFHPEALKEDTERLMRFTHRAKRRQQRPTDASWGDY